MQELLMAPVKRQRLHEIIADRLQEMIVRGEFRAGEALPTENEMAEQFQVSRTVVRDAIRVLATKGLVEIRHGVGTFVTQSGRDRLAEAIALSVRRGDYTPWELYLVRRALELVVVEEAIHNATPEHIAAMRQAMDDYERNAFDAEKAVEAHIRFHRIMLESTGKRILMDLLEPITVFRIPYEWGTEKGEVPAPQRYAAGHRRIVDAIEARDVERARQAMLDHLADLERRARRAMEARKPAE